MYLKTFHVFLMYTSNSLFALYTNGHHTFYNYRPDYHTGVPVSQVDTAHDCFNIENWFGDVLDLSVENESDLIDLGLHK